MSVDMPTTDDAVLGGRLVLRQPKRGHRVGHDAILLAAATGGVAGEHAVDLGAGVGAAGLALARRVAGLQVTLVELDADLAALAAGNAARNGMTARVRAVSCDVEDVAALAAAGLAEGSAERVLMNPPFNDSHRQKASPDARKRLAHVAGPGLLRGWIGSAAWLLKPRGRLTLIWRAEGLDEVLTALGPGFGNVAVTPVLPQAGVPAIRVLVRAEKSAGGSRRDFPGLVLNESGRASDAAEAILRAGGTLPMSED
jgi:tRNA1(Val) A37 N6-methylase TrmN6